MDIFRYIEGISYKLGLKVANYFHEDKDGIEETQYGMFAILSFLFEFGTGLIISLIFGYVKYFLVFQITYCFLRSVCGGEHCKTFASCWAVTNIISFVGSIAAILLSCNYTISMVGILLLFLSSVDMIHILDMSRSIIIEIQWMLYTLGASTQRKTRLILKRFIGVLLLEIMNN